MEHIVLCVSLVCSALAAIAAAAQDDGSNKPREWPNGGPDVTKFTYVEENGLTKIGLLPQVPPDNMRNSEGDLIELRDGRILLFYCHFTGGYGDHATAHLAGRFSSDRGMHWTKEDVVILPNEGGMNVMCPSLLRLQSGEIGLFYLRKDSPQNCHLYLRTSTDEAKTWSKPTCCMPDAPGYFVVNNGRVIQLAAGRIVVPAASGGLQEPAVAELKDGRLFMVSRTALGRQYGCWSSDAGQTWTSPAKPLNIISPRDPCAIKRIPKTGHLLLVWVDHAQAPLSLLGGYFGGRATPLHAAISRDEGLTWDNVKVIENDPEGWYVYPAICFVGDRVLLTYCAGNHPYHMGKSQVTVFDVDWLYEE